MAKSKKINNLPALAGDVTLSNYLNEIKKFPMLSAEEEYTLANRLTIHGDTDAAHQLVTSHLRLVAKLAMGYKGYGLPITDIISEGNVGLMQAVQKFDPENLGQGMLVDLGEHLVYLLAATQFPTGNAKDRKEGTEFFQVFRIRFGVHPEDSRQMFFSQLLGHGLVGKKHEFLDQLVALVAFALDDFLRGALVVDQDLYFRGCKVKRTGFHPESPDLRCYAPKFPNRFLEFGELFFRKFEQRFARISRVPTGGRFGCTNFLQVSLLHEENGLFVSESLVALDHRFGKFRAKGFSLLGESEQDGFHQAFFGFDQTAYATRKTVGEHGHDFTHQIGRVAPFLCLFVQLGARSDVM